MRDARGSVLVATAAMTAVIVLAAALTLDVGSMLAERSRLQAVADAAALAGAAGLPDPDRARALAEEYAQRNGIGPADTAVEVDPDGTRVRVQVSGEAGLWLAPAAGFPSRVRLTAGATAERAAAGAVQGAQPLGVELTDFVLGELYELKLGSHSPQGPHKGNFHALALGEHGADTYKENLAHGYQGWLEAGQEVETEPGNMEGPTREGLRRRLEDDPDSTWDRPRTDSPRVLLVPVIDTFDEVEGRDRVRILGFAAFFLEDVRSGEVTGRFIAWTVAGRPGGTEAGDYGTRVIRLVR